MALAREGFERGFAERCEYSLRLLLNHAAVRPTRIRLAHSRLGNGAADAAAGASAQSDGSRRRWEEEGRALEREPEVALATSKMKELQKMNW